MIDVERYSITGRVIRSGIKNDLLCSIICKSNHNDMIMANVLPEFEQIDWRG